MGSGFGAFVFCLSGTYSTEVDKGLQPLSREGPVLPRSAHRGKHPQDDAGRSRILNRARWVAAHGCSSLTG